MKDTETLWYPSRAFLFLWKLERRLFSNFAGSGYEFLRYRNGMLMTFWTRAQAQARADELNAVDSVLEGMVAPAQEYTSAAYEQQRPSVLFRPGISIDGNQYCALYGNNLQDGVAGFGDSPALAMASFDKHWNAKLGASP